ncbi:MAG: TetR/AcrR family transcriptional regulator [Thomasclavelia sp.]
MNRTELAIVTAFWQLLEEKPYNKITVKNIVERCDINRNTFYYHFQDIPDLLDKALKKDIDELLNSYQSYNSFLDYLTPIIDACLKKKKQILNIYHSSHQEFFVHQINQIAYYVSEKYIDILINGIEILDEDKKLLIRFNKCLLMGVTLDWFDHEADFDLIKALKRIEQILKDSNRHLLLFKKENQ